MTMYKVISPDGRLLDTPSCNLKVGMIVEVNAN